MGKTPKHGYEIPRNEETPESDLHRCIIEAIRSSDPNVVRAAAEATAELARRQSVEWKERFNAESRERVKGQQFQQAQTERQLDVAEKQLDAASRAKSAAWAAAWATIAVAVATIALAVTSAVQLLTK